MRSNRSDKNNIKQREGKIKIYKQNNCINDSTTLYIPLRVHQALS
jgi:hypothetical protein